MATHDEMCTEISAPANGISSSDNSFENMFIPLIPFVLFLQDKCIRNIINAAWKHCRKAAVAVDDLATASC